MLQVLKKKVIFKNSEADYLAVIADESTEISGQSQLVKVFRYINKSSGEDLEHFCGYFCPESVKSEGILKQFQIIFQGNQETLLML